MSCTEIPYHTQLKGRVMEVVPDKDQVAHRPLCTLVESGGQGYVLMGTTHAIAPAAGQNIVMEFLPHAGPTKGFWKIISLAA